MEINDHRIACVGDLVRYPDGKESEIVSGAGIAAAFDGRPLAIVAVPPTTETRSSIACKTKRRWWSTSTTAFQAFYSRVTWRSVRREALPHYRGGEDHGGRYRADRLGVRQD
ncbi:hypothetical protein QNM99_22885 [Pseudomonas sp. PCH446]